MQTFLGTLHLIVDNGKLYAINELSVEDYLTSVISSEMSATSSLELLKAHAVISRSWLLAQIEKRKSLGKGTEHQEVSTVRTDNELVRWFDREDHTLFDVCADDHCQRYQGITKATSPHVKMAIDATRGQVLFSEGSICDARFSKCCGGISEEFQYCWENIRKPYLLSVEDKAPLGSIPTMDLTNEEAAREWILSSPEAFCNTHDEAVLGQVLNNYDQETQDFLSLDCRVYTGRTICINSPKDRYRLWRNKESCTIITWKERKNLSYEDRRYEAFLCHWQGIRDKKSIE